MIEHVAYDLGCKEAADIVEYSMWSSFRACNHCKLQHWELI